MATASDMTKERSSGAYVRRPEAGFSLVEMLVVLAILAAVASTIFLNSPAATPNLAKEADKVAAQLLSARDLAIIENRPVLVEFDPSGYRVQQRSRFGWNAAPGVQMVAWGEGTSYSVEGGALASAVLFDSIGLTDPVAITLFRKGRIERISLDGTGNVERRGGGQ